jgi:hypothetical protein
MLTLWHGTPTGRLLVHDPADGSTSQLADGLWYANGCALAPDASYVAVCETCSMRVRRYWLTGPQVGEKWCGGAVRWSSVWGKRLQTAVAFHLCAVTPSPHPPPTTTCTRPARSTR